MSRWWLGKFASKYHSILPSSFTYQYSFDDYISLEKIRYGNRLEASFNAHGDLNGKMVAPLLILPFVENCFKHGVSEEIDRSWVSIDLSYEKDELILKVENSKSANGDQEDRFNYKDRRR